MKKTTIAILFTVLITLSCIFYSCNKTGGLFSTDENTGTTADSYTTIIKDLENQIVELQQNQYISDAERRKEIAKLEQLLNELKQKPPASSDTDTSNNSNTDASTETEEPKSPKFLYTVTEGNATITGLEGNTTVLAIPSSIDGYSVTSIGDNAFLSETITEIIVPSSVTKIGWFAFAGCSKLKTVTITESVTSIGYSAFPTDIKSFSLLCPNGSFAAKYADSYGISHTPV